MMKRFSCIIPLLLGLCLAFTTLSCQHREENYEVPKPKPNTWLSVAVDDMCDELDTKSILDGGIETKLTNLTVAVYDGSGSLYDTKNITAGFDNLEYSFTPDETYHIYALANMGDMRSAFPANHNESTIAAISYLIPGYTTPSTGVNARGIPMAGTLVFTAGVSDATVIPLTRLLAKLNVSLYCNWPGNITSVKVKNLNAKLKPFGDSAAASAGDILSEEEVEIPATAVNEGSFVFYIPENKQGTISGITQSSDKKSDNSGSSNPVNAKADIASYLEAVVTGDTSKSADGTITYRSYLGGNSTTDFNIVRNSRYVWSIVYQPDGMVNDDWKHENDLSWTRYIYSLSPSTGANLYLNQTATYHVKATVNDYANGVLVSSSSVDNVKPTQSWWLQAVGSDVPISGSDNVVNLSLSEPYYYNYIQANCVGVGEGTRDLFVRVTDDYGVQNLSTNIKVLSFSRVPYLYSSYGGGSYSSITGDVIHVNTGATVSYDLYCQKSGSVSSDKRARLGSDNLKSCRFRVWDSDYSTIHSKNMNDDDDFYDYASDSYTFTSAGTYIIYAGTVYDDDGVDHSMLTDDLVVIVSDDTYYSLSVEPSYKSVAKDGTFSTSDFTVYKEKYVNGSYDSRTVVTSGLSWSIENGTGSISRSGSTITGTGVGSAILTVTSSDSQIDYPSANVLVTVTAPVEVISYRVSRIEFNKSTLDYGETATATVYRQKYVNVVASGSEEVVPNSYFDWTSSLPAIASVDGGVVTAGTGSNGTPLITATLKSAYTSDYEIGFYSVSGSINVSHDAVITYQYKVITSLSPSGIKLGQSSTASATKYRMTLVDGVPSGGWVEDGSVTSSGFTAISGSDKVTISGSTISSVATGTAVIKSSYTADLYENATLTISDADYDISIDPASGIDLILGKKTSASYTASATKNGSAATDGTYEWTVSPSGRVTLSNANTTTVTVTADTQGDVTLTVSYKVGSETKASASVTFTVYSNSLSLDLNKTSIAVNETCDATVTYTSNGTNTNVTSASTLTAYAGSTGSTTSSIVTFNSNGVITGASAGDCWIEASYTSGGYTYTSSRVKLTVTNNPLTLSWKGNKEPTYVSQRGKIEVSGLDDPSATLTYEDLNNNIIFTDSYGVSFTADDYNIRVTASNGQVGYLTGTIKAPVLTPSSTTLYANPDGSEAMSGTDGLSGNALSVCYKNELGNVTFLISTDTDDSNLATGSNLHPTYYNMLLAPQYSSNASIVTATSGGSIYANDVYTPTTGTLATITISPYNMGYSANITEVASASLTIKGVNPFTDWESEVITLPDEEDFGLINKYRAYASHSYSGHSATFGKISATTGRHGVEVFRNGSVLASGTLKNCFTNTYNSTDGWHTSYTLSESALSEHVAGLLELKGYVQNSHSSNRIYINGAKLGVYVNGAIGAKMTGIGTNVVQISTAWAGDEGSYGFNMVSGYNLVRTDYHSGDSFGYISNTTIQNVPAEGTSLNAVVYELRREGATLNSAMEIMEAERPRFEFCDVTGVGVFNTDGLISYYYLHPANTPTVYDPSLSTNHGYYRLWLLESIEGTPGSGPKQGWILDD